jgi:pimeloyl-ACP methyl ester carboxylesterase
MGNGEGIDGVVLVHGGHHDSRCWQLLLPLLDVPAIAVDLPGRGHRSPDGQPVTIHACAAAVLEDADAAGFDRFVLVGHSMGGLTISRVAIDAPERVAHLVYVGALAPPAGTSVSQALGVDVAPDAPDDAMLPALPEELTRALFGNDMTDEQWAIAREGIVAEAAFLFRDSLPRYAIGIPTTYIGMVHDVPVPPPLAAHMIEQLGPDVDVRSIDAGHNVMLSQPDTLAAVLTEIVATA